MFLRVTTICCLLLFCTAIQADVLELEGTIKSLDADKREIMIGTKTLDVAKKCRITIDGREAALADLKVDQKVVVEYDDDLEVAKSITVGDDVPDDTATARDLKAMQGEWVCVVAEENGKATERADVRRENRTLAVKGNTLTMERLKGTAIAKWTGKFEVNPKTKAFDWVGRTQEGGHVEWTGIYAVEGEGLKLCFRFSPDGSAPRPKKFTTQDWEKGFAMAFYTFKKYTEESSGKP